MNKTDMAEILEPQNLIGDRFRILIRTRGDALFLGIVIFFGIVLTMALTATWTAYLIKREFVGPVDGPTWGFLPPQRPTWEVLGKDQLSVLIVGTDEHLEFDHGRSDTIMWALLDFRNGKADILSIPRDLLVWLPRKHADFDKICHAYGYGGVELVEESLEGFLGVQVDQVLKVDYDGFRRIVDTLGGVVIDVEHDMNYDDNAGDLHIHIDKGPQKLNGMNALDYVRFRNDRKGDFGRMERQQVFLNAIKKQGLRIEHIGKIDDIARIASESLILSPSMDIEEIAAITRFFSNLPDSDISFHSIPVDRDVYYNKLMSLSPDYRKLDELMKSILRSEEGPEESEKDIGADSEPAQDDVV